VIRLKILLFVTSIYNTLENETKEDFKNISNLLKKIKELNNDDLILISICDYTENINVLQSYLMKFKENELCDGEQFTGNLHYMSNNGGSILYKNGTLNKIDEIIDYIKRLENNNNSVELIICDGIMNIDEYTKAIEKNLNINCFYIYSFNDISKIIESLEDIYEYKKLKLKI
jgi:hypothetical protein